MSSFGSKTTAKAFGAEMMRYRGGGVFINSLPLQI
jgi:hypothetical protein